MGGGGWGGGVGRGGVVVRLFTDLKFGEGQVWNTTVSGNLPSQFRYSYVVPAFHSLTATVLGFHFTYLLKDLLPTCVHPSSRLALYSWYQVRNTSPSSYLVSGPVRWRPLGEKARALYHKITSDYEISANNSSSTTWV